MYHGTMGRDGQKGPSMYPRPGTGGMSHGIPGTMGQWHVPKSQWTFYGNAGQLCLNVDYPLITWLCVTGP